MYSISLNSGVSLFSKSARLLALSLYTVERQSLAHTGKIAVVSIIYIVALYI